MEKVPFIVTGASGSIGSEATRGILTKGKPVIMAVRNIAKAEPIKSSLEEEIPGCNISIMKLDLSSFESVVSFVDTLKAQNITPCGLLNNAATLNRDYSVTKDGLETTVQTNYAAVYLLTRMLMPIMTEQANIVNTVSVTRKIAKMDKNFFDNGKDEYSQLGTYSTTKFALLMFTGELIKRYGDKFHINATDPGVVNSNMISMHRWFDPLADIFFRPFIKSPRKGAMPAINASFASQSGDLYRKNSHTTLSSQYEEHPLSSWLWETTEKILKDRNFNL